MHCRGLVVPDRTGCALGRTGCAKDMTGCALQRTEGAPDRTGGAPDKTGYFPLYGSPTEMLLMSSRVLFGC